MREMRKLFQSDEREQERLRRFFAEEATWFPNHSLLSIGAGILLSISMVSMCIPVCILSKKEFYMLLYTYIPYYMGINVYGMKFSTYKESSSLPVVSKQAKPLYLLLRYFPVSRKELARFYARKLGKLCMILTLIILSIRIPFSLFAYHKIAILDILLPLSLNFLFPVAGGYLVTAHKG